MYANATANSMKKCIKFEILQTIVAKKLKVGD